MANRGYIGEEDFIVHYIVNVDGNNIGSLHGQPEVDEDEREMCVLKDYGKDKFWAFMTGINKDCGSKGECWEDVAKKLGVVPRTIQRWLKSQTKPKEKQLRLLSQYLAEKKG